MFVKFFETLLHLITIKLYYYNYLLWLDDISTPRSPRWGVDPWVCPGLRLWGGGSGRAQWGRHVQRLPHLPQRPGHQPGAHAFNFDFHTAYLLTVIKIRIWCFTGASTGKEQRRKERGRRKSGRCDHIITIYFASTIIKHLHTIT